MRREVWAAAGPECRGERSGRSPRVRQYSGPQGARASWLLPQVASGPGSEMDVRAVGPRASFTLSEPRVPPRGGGGQTHPSAGRTQNSARDSEAARAPGRAQVTRGHRSSRPRGPRRAPPPPPLLRGGRTYPRRRGRAGRDWAPRSVGLRPSGTHGPPLPGGNRRAPANPHALAPPSVTPRGRGCLPENVIGPGRGGEAARPTIGEPWGRVGEQGGAPRKAWGSRG